MSFQAGRALRDIGDTSCESGTPGATSVTPLLNPDVLWAALVTCLLSPEACSTTSVTPLLNSDTCFHNVDDTCSELGRPLRDIGYTSSDTSQHDGGTSPEPGWLLLDVYVRPDGQTDEQTDG
ncbi:unnamed protein product [Heligmosomoides polygyrus]|uniref:Pancreatic secretory granule membrane major glycoprotein GP2 n=1 Tax=Heligmosomoides polygyrus TaxID=6339 RepID=A0A183FI24_HELPZ|nr:unnamed protein product [Heligmosomoides polygyrus]